MSLPSESSFELDEEDAERVTATRAGFGRYRLLYQIASGGMATVFLARAVGPGGFDRPVAIKRIHPHLARRKHFLEMFLDEARIASRINHPNICTVFDFGAVDGTYYLAMEYLVGVPLQRLLHEVSIRPRVLASKQWHVFASRIVADAAAGLHAAHETRDDTGNLLHVVHRDVSPQNLFVTFDGVVKVVDFGVARAADRAHRTTTGTLKGKLSYMAPEHAGGQAVDRRADVWSLGVCLWEALTGRRLFKRENEMDTLLAVRSMHVKAPSEIQRGIPAELDAIVVRALERDPAERFESAREMNRALEAFVRASGVPAGIMDLAELMEPLVQEQHTEKRQLLKTVMEDARADVVHEQQTRQIAPGAEMSGIRDTVITTPGEGTVLVRQRERRRLLFTGVLAASAALFGAAVALTLVGVRDDSSDEPADTSGVAAPGSEPQAESAKPRRRPKPKPRRRPRPKPKPSRTLRPRPGPRPRTRKSPTAQGTARGCTHAPAPRRVAR
jgi:serine/threonine-protein kinase